MKIIKPFIFAIKGVLYCSFTQRNFRIHSVAAFLVALAGWLLGISALEWVAVALCVAIVMVAEMINTAIELLCDLYSSSYNSTIMVIKDIAAGTVLVASVISMFVGSIIFMPKIFHILNISL